MTGNGTRPGQNAFSARCSMTTESLPPENSSTGRSSSLTASRMMWMPSASSSRRWLSWRTGAKPVETSVVGSSVVVPVETWVVLTWGPPRGGWW